VIEYTPKIPFSIVNVYVEMRDDGLAKRNVFNILAPLPTNFAEGF